MAERRRRDGVKPRPGCQRRPPPPPPSSSVLLHPSDPDLKTTVNSYSLDGSGGLRRPPRLVSSFPPLGPRGCTGQVDSASAVL